MKTKTERMVEVLDQATVLQTEMEADESKNTSDNRDLFKSYMDQATELKNSIQQDQTLTGFKSFMTEPANEPKATPHVRAGDGAEAEPFQGYKSLGEQFVESEAYKASGGVLKPGQIIGVEAKNYRTPFGQQKATFTSAGTNVNTTVNYLPGLVDIKQQPLSIRDLLASGQTTQNAVTYIQETSFTNAATTVAEEGLKPEATFATSVAVATVKKIAVIGRVTDEMFADMPMMRDYVNERLRFMVLQREEAQLYSGNGTGSNILGLTATAGIQTQACGTISATNPVTDSIFKAITKVRTIGFMEPDGIVIHPTDYQIIRLTKDTANQYFGGGPFTGAYGNDSGIELNPRLWGLKTVVTTAATVGTALVGAFRMGAQIWQREGITVDTSNSDASDFQYNRVAIRVEERLALAVYRPLAFCTVTAIA